MRKLITAIMLTFLTLGPGSAIAQERHTLGFARLFSNDYIGDGRDRWRTGSYTVSVLRGQEWSGRRPEVLGSLMEYRLRSEIIAPGRTSGGISDRPYVGAISMSVLSHVSSGPIEGTIGLEVLAIGPRTGLSDFQSAFHNGFAMPQPLGTDQQLGDAIHIGGTAELVWSMRLSDSVTIRPFIEAQAGIEGLARVGADVIIGAVGHDDLLTRDVVSGQLMRGVVSDATGFSLVAGADWAQVWNSVYLPIDRGYAPLEFRWRARAGVHWQFTPDISVFYGATYLSEEFIGQPEGQLIAGLTLNFNF